MTKDYSKGKVYKIEPIVEHEEGDIYIGSTTKDYLSQRMTAHRRAYNTWANGGKEIKNIRSYTLFDKYGIENCRIFILEEVRAKSLSELIAREGYYIKTLKCVNKNVPTRTRKEWVNDSRERINTSNRAIYQRTKDKVNQQRRLFYEDNKDTVNVQCNCICGSVFTQRMKKRHEKTIKHTAFIQQNNNI
jgi:hypothetical protein